MHRADVQDGDGGLLLVATLFGMHRFLAKLFADGGYRGAQFRKGLTNMDLAIEIARRPDHAKPLVALSHRWIVERTMAWLRRCRRLAKDWENLNRKALIFLRLASIRLMLPRLCNPS
jgi:transposase